jgi:hypothetical protein
VTDSDRHRVAIGSSANGHCVQSRGADACDGARGTDFEATGAEGQYGNEDSKTKADSAINHDDLSAAPTKRTLRRSCVMMHPC